MWHITRTNIEINNPILTKIVSKYLYRFNKTSNHIFKLNCINNKIVYIHNDRENYDEFMNLYSYVYENKENGDIYDYVKQSLVKYFDVKEKSKDYQEYFVCFVRELETKHKEINESYNSIEEVSNTDTDEWLFDYLDYRIYFNFNDRCNICHSPLISSYKNEQFKILCSNNDCDYFYDDFNDYNKISEYNFLKKYPEMLKIVDKLEKTEEKYNDDYPFLPPKPNYFCDIINAISPSFSDYKNIIKDLILITPLTYKYFNHSIIDIKMVKELLNDFYPNDNYKSFCSDKRFYLFLRKKERKNLDKNIVNVISKYVKLKKLKFSSDYVGLCPFHNDMNASLRVSPNKGIWKCFSCGSGGRAYDFIKQFNVNNQEYVDESSLMYKRNIKNSFYYYLFANLPSELKYNKEVIELFLNIDGCILKIVPKELRYDKGLVELAIQNDVTSYRYIIGNKELAEKYLKENPCLIYYAQKRTHNSKKRKNKKNKSMNLNEDHFKKIDDEVVISDENDLPF